MVLPLLVPESLLLYKINIEISPAVPMPSLMAFNRNFVIPRRVVTSQERFLSNKRPVRSQMTCHCSMTCSPWAAANAAWRWIGLPYAPAISAVPASLYTDLSSPARVLTNSDGGLQNRVQGSTRL